MSWSGKLKEVAQERGETLVLAPGLDQALLAQERLHGRVEEPYDKVKAQAELKEALGSFKGKVRVPDGIAQWAQLEKAIEATQQHAQAARTKVEPPPAPQQKNDAEIDAVKAKLLNDVVVQFFGKEDPGREDEDEEEEEEEQGMGR